GVEVEHHAVGQVRLPDGRAPGVELQHAELNQLDHRVGIARIDVAGLPAGFLLEPRAAYVLEAGDHVLLEEAGLPGTFRATDDRGGTVNHARQEPVHHAGVVVGHFLLGDAVVGIHHAVGMGDGDVG